MWYIKRKFIPYNNNNNKIMFTSYFEGSSSNLTTKNYKIVVWLILNLEGVFIILLKLMKWEQEKQQLSAGIITIVRLNLINHVLTLFRDKFACNTALRNPVFRWKSCKGSVWESVKKCSRLCSEAGTCGWISREARSLQAAKSCTCAEHAGELNSHAN